MLYSRPLLVSYFKCVCVFSHFCHDPVGWSLPDSSVHGMGSPFYFYFFSFIYWFIYSIVVVLPYIDMNPPWVYMCSPSWTPLPPPSPSHPSGSSQCTNPEHPVSCMEPGLAIRFTYDNLHVSMPFSHIVPPAPSPTESKRCSKHLCLFCCLAYRVIVTIFLNSIYMC